MKKKDPLTKTMVDDAVIVVALPDIAIRMAGITGSVATIEKTK
ncbi:hypothetical protein [Dictyobacter kobayashii]|uniref:Uncharacterized protein n=1 Tax=Dictyobacter kobayashii TaxID=2014872 RepID=A0A402AT64_9CHLR|nr:hypothetical protein [Dictyobacter kobayashii]GCE22233.1 hypothetical protein KDK_60330 [Dictyobacter kobayashii]